MLCFKNSSTFVSAKKWKHKWMLGNLFIHEYAKEFGIDHIYNCDTFNEMDPKTNNTEYLATVSKAIYQVSLKMI